MNMNKQASGTLLQRANQAFRKNEFALAIELYKQSSDTVPILASSLLFNIELATKRLKENQSSNIASTTEHVERTQGSIFWNLTKPEDMDDFYFDKIVASGLFDVDYYISVCDAHVSDIKNPLSHYIDVGSSFGLNPSQGFNTEYYLNCNPDVAESGINPLIHYVCNGQAEGREPLPKPYTSDYEVEPVKYVERLPNNTAPVNSAVRTICFYLPQFHSIPENDKWWGEGFTEWTNVIPAVPQFAGHYQPHVPHRDIGYYNLLNRDDQAKQIELAKLYGIEGFCYYLYWFSGQRLLEQPLDNMLADSSLDLPFCVCWANENWSRRWDGLENDLLMVQNYSPEDDLAFIANIAKYLNDPRYIRVSGKPLILIYRPNLFPDMRATAQRWRTWCIENGVGEIYLAYPQSFETVDPEEYDFDAAIEFPPNNSNPPRITSQVEPSVQDFKTTVYDWRVFVERSDAYIDPGYKLFRSATPSWDNTARKKNKGTVFHNSCPVLFERYLSNAFSETIFRREDPSERLVFINAWNEWAEGAHLEPDERYGYAWLQAVRNSHENINKSRKKILLVSHDAHPHGAQVLCLNIARELALGFNFDVEMLVLGDGILIQKFKQYANVHLINMRELGSSLTQELLFKLYSQGVNHAIVNTTVSGVITPYLKNIGINIVSLIHELPRLLQSYSLEESASLINECSDLIVFPAQQVQDGFENFIDKKVDNCVIRAQGLFQPSILRRGKAKEECRTELRALYGMPNDAKIVLNVAFADYRKGFDLFVQACCNVFDIIPNSYAIWVGHHDKAIVEESIALIINPSHRKRIIMTNGYVDNPQLFYAGADVFALTSREDPFPSVVLESLDAETPVVAFKESGGFDTLLNKGCGLLAESGNVLSFVFNLIRILNDNELSISLSQVGKKLIESEYRFKNYVSDLIQLSGLNFLKVSVVIPNYNYEHYIIERIKSVLEQTYPIYEIIVLDDCSSDNSDFLIKNYLKDIEIPYVYDRNLENSGSVFKQWRKGIDMASGDLIWIAEADDLSDNKFLEKLVPFFSDDSEVSIAYSQSKQMDENGNCIAEDYCDYTEDLGNFWDEDYIVQGVDEIRRALSVKNTIPNVSGVLFAKNKLVSALNNSSEQLKEFKVAGDWLVYVNVAMQGKIAFCKSSLNYHRRHTASVTKINNHMDEILLMQRYCNELVELDDEIIMKRERYNAILTKHFGLTDEL